jgi:hypothetical protein
MTQDDVRDHGVMVGLLSEVHADRIVVGQMPFFLTDGMPCRYFTGTYVQVVYIEQDGRRTVKHVALFPRAHPLGARDTRLPAV